MLWLYLVTVSFLLCHGGLASSKKDKRPTKYILYDVNPGEGFNLRRDVYMRMAVFVRKLNIEDDKIRWVLVLPPWGHLYHWKSRKLGPQTKIPWAAFFDLKSLGLFVHVMEFEDWVSVSGGIVDSVYYLQGYKEGWKDGKFEQKYDVRDCLEPPRYHEQYDGGVYEGEFFHFENIFARKFSCLSVQGSASILSDLVRDHEGLSLMLDRAENVLHDWFGDAEYWAARRSMQFSERLIQQATEFRAEELASRDSEENTEVTGTDWRWRSSERKKRGGEYACVHLRRGDFARSRGTQVPSVEWAARQLNRRLEELELSKLFVSTDADQKEIAELKRNLNPDFDMKMFRPDQDQLEDFKDGGVAIIDQIICSHARYFIGTRESTFTFRIQEEREMMGFREQDTFDMLCTEGEYECESGSQWKIVWAEGRDWSLPEGEKVKDRSEL